MMNAEKSFKALVKTARAHNFKVSYFRSPDCSIDGNILGASIRINSSRSYETRLKTLVLLLSKHDFFGMKNGYAVVESDKEAGGMSAHIAFFRAEYCNCNSSRVIHMAKLIDLTGQRFGRLVVIERAENAKNGKAKWLCLCDCGNNTIVLGTHLNSGHTQSCGCIHSEVVCAVMNKHGACDSRLYRIWAGMIKRTYNQQSKDFGYYGGRGITVCDSWKNDFQPFHDWAIESGYSDNLTLDRIDNQKGYSPDNCRWVTMKIQCNNKSNNRFIEFRGERKTLSQWADLLGIKGCTLLWRLRKGWSIEKALSTPPQKQEQIVSIKK